ncbi:hypothetical protein QQ045_028957 [Rhodiola kirilowii]
MSIQRWSSLSEVSEKELRDVGFGYRASYIVSTVKALQLKSGGGLEWLASLRKVQLKDAIDGLLTLKGAEFLVMHEGYDACGIVKARDSVGRYDLFAARLTLKQSHGVADAFVSIYGNYAGWAQNLLFIVCTKAANSSQLRYHQRQKASWSKSAHRYQLIGVRFLSCRGRTQVPVSTPSSPTFLNKPFRLLQKHKSDSIAT